MAKELELIEVETLPLLPVWVSVRAIGRAVETIGPKSVGVIEVIENNPTALYEDIELMNSSSGVPIRRQSSEYYRAGRIRMDMRMLAEYWPDIGNGELFLVNEHNVEWVTR